MADHSITATGDTGPLPADDLNRSLTVSEPDNADLLHLSLVGDSYTVLVSGKQTEGRYCLIDMLVPDGSGPPPHRHDFEEMFTLLEGEVEFTFRGQTMNVPQGATVNIPANAPHQFRNILGRTVQMLCMCTPAGQEEFFAQVGDRVASRTSRPPQLSKEEQAERGKKAAKLAPRYRTEML
jgi:mannose-6-phosphate isomerase-like protein (cupin superfamily)